MIIFFSTIMYQLPLKEYYTMIFFLNACKTEICSKSDSRALIWIKEVRNTLDLSPKWLESQLGTALKITHLSNISKITKNRPNPLVLFSLYFFQQLGLFRVKLMTIKTYQFKCCDIIAPCCTTQSCKKSFFVF